MVSNSSSLGSACKATQQPTVQQHCFPSRDGVSQLKHERAVVSLPHLSFLPEKETAQIGPADFALTLSLVSRPPLGCD